LFSRKTGMEKIKLLLVYRFSLSFRIDDVIRSVRIAKQKRKERDWKGRRNDMSVEAGLEVAGVKELKAKLERLDSKLKVKVSERLAEIGNLIEESQTACASRDWKA